MKPNCKLKFFLISFVFIILLGVSQDESGRASEIIPVMKFKDADIKIVMQSIAQKAEKNGEKINIVVSPGVEGLVSVNLENVDWFTALEAVLRPYDYTYEWIGENILLIDSYENIKEREAQAKERQEVEPARTKVFKLNYIDAGDAKKAIEPLLSGIGRVTILELTGKSGWEFGAEASKAKREAKEIQSRTKIIIVSDVAKKLAEVESFLAQIDVMPMQVLIKTRIMEVNRDFLEDIGFDWGTGRDGASSTDLNFQKFNDANTQQGAGHFLSDQITPAAFNPLEDTGTALTTTNTGLKLAFRKIAGTEFEIILHALEEDSHTNTLSAPAILTLDNQPASILVGEKFPIIKTETSTETSQITGGSLDYYQDIGIQLNVVPQISGPESDFINMIIHPVVSAQSSTVSVTDQAGTVLVSYPLLTIREAETQVMLQDGETIVIGGLIKDVKQKQEIGIPVLGDIPLVGWMFKRYTENITKVDLLIFITASIVKPGELIPEEVFQVSKSSPKAK